MRVSTFHKINVRIKMNFKFKMPFIKGIFFVVIFAYSGLSIAQSIDSSNFIHKTLSTLSFRYDTRSSFIQPNSGRVSGLKVGLSINNKVKLGIGYSWLLFPLYSLNYGNGTSLNANKLTLWYISPYLEYTFLNSKRWEFTMFSLLGSGRVLNDQIFEINNQFDKVEKSTMLVLEPYAFGIYKIVPWFGLGTGLGYRFIINLDEDIKNLSSPTYVLKAKIYTSEIIRFLRK